MSGPTQHHTVTVSHFENHDRSCFGVYDWLGLLACPKGATIYKDSYRVGETACATNKTPSPGPHGHRKKCPQECMLWSMDRTQVPS